jgi:hypothetical protein
MSGGHQKGTSRDHDALSHLGQITAGEAKRHERIRNGPPLN